MSPVRNIPSFEETRRRTPARGASHNHDDRGASNGSEGLLIDLDTPAQPPAPSSSEERANPFDGFNAEAIRDEMAAVREREEQERRERERKAILQQREARRKSMGASRPMRISQDLHILIYDHSQPPSIFRARGNIAHMECGGNSRRLDFFIYFEFYPTRLEFSEH